MDALTTHQLSPASTFRETSTKAPTRLAKSPRPWVTLLATSSRTTTGGSEGGVPRPNKLRRPERGGAVHHALRSTLEYQVLQVGEGLGQREAALVEREAIAEDLARDLERCFRRPHYLAQHKLQPLLMMTRELVYPTSQVVEEGAVPRQYEVRRDVAHIPHTLQIAGKGVRLRLRPAADVRCDLEQDVVGGEEYPSLLVVDHDLVVRVAGRVHHPSSPGTQGDLLPCP